MSLTVPVIDISRLPEDPVTIQAIARACEEWGFFQITGHGIEPSQKQALLDAMRQVFRLPVESRRAVLRSEANPMGFYDEELTKNTRDWKQIFDYGIDYRDPAVTHASRWPADLPGFRDNMLDWFERCETISFALLTAIERALDVQVGAMTRAFDPVHTSFVRLNYYPVCDDPAPADSASDIERGMLGVNRHTDAGALTVLVQDDVPALQVNRDDRWYTIFPEDDGLIINVGDMLQVWSNDRFRAPEHRVIASADRERLSAPFFFNPAYATDCVPLGVTGDAAHYERVNWGHFRNERAHGDYGDYGEEIQISQFRREPQRSS